MRYLLHWDEIMLLTGSVILIVLGGKEVMIIFNQMLDVEWDYGIFFYYYFSY